MKEITKFYKKVLYNFKNKINIDKELLDNKSLDELFNYFGTDKGTKVINPYLHDSNEILGHGFAKFYEKKLLDFKYDIFKILEIGTWEGASTAALASFFPNSIIYGLDKNFRFSRLGHIKKVNFSLSENFYIPTKISQNKIN